MRALNILLHWLVSKAIFSSHSFRMYRYSYSGCLKWDSRPSNSSSCLMDQQRLVSLHLDASGGIMKALKIVGIWCSGPPAWTVQTPPAPFACPLACLQNLVAVSCWQRLAGSGSWCSPRAPVFSLIVVGYLVCRPQGWCLEGLVESWPFSHPTCTPITPQPLWFGGWGLVFATHEVVMVTLHVRLLCLWLHHLSRHLPNAHLLLMT